MAKTPVPWSDEVDEVMRGDVTAAVGLTTSAGGVVVTAVAPCGLVDRPGGVVGFTTALSFSKKLERLITNPKTALAYHARDHGFSTSSRFVLADGVAHVELAPSRERLEALVPQVERYLGHVKRGRLWDRLLHEYYRERVVVDVAVHRIVAWPDLACAGEPTVVGAERADDPQPQRPPRRGTRPRVDVGALVGQLTGLPHRLLGYRGADGYPVLVPVDLAGHDADGLRVVASPGLLPRGARRAGLLSHAYRPQLVGLRTRTLTGWLEVDDDGRAVYAPHTSKGFAAPPNKTLLLVSNGLLAKYGHRRAQRRGVLEALERLQADAPARGPISRP
jgi:hypothetical protein